jgi:hypothetical protein
LLFYLSTVQLAEFITVIVVLFGCVVILLVNLLLLYGSARSKQHLLLPWLAVSGPATLALLLYTSIQWAVIAPYQPVYVAAIAFSSYFCAVVVTQFHELRRQSPQKAPLPGGGEVELGEGVGTPRPSESLPLDDSMLLELETDPPGLPQPEEVISVAEVTKLATNNPFLEDVFKVAKAAKAAKPSAVSSATLDIRSDFTPFKKEDPGRGEAGGELPAMMRVFLPNNADGEESDFDFSFTDPAFDSSLCATSNLDPTE